MTIPAEPPAGAPASLAYVAPVPEQAARNERQAASAERQAAGMEQGAKSMAEMAAVLAADADVLRRSIAPTDADIVRTLLPALAAQGLHGLAALAKARETVAAYRFFFKG